MNMSTQAHTLPFFTGYTLNLRFVLLSVLLLLHLPALRAQSAPATVPLEAGKPIERALAGDVTHSYSITLGANQFLRVVVDQKGIDVEVALFAPDGKQIVKVDGPNGSAGPESISVIAEATGSYRLEVRSLEAKAAAGRYQVRVEELRAATAQDKSRVAGKQALAEAALIDREGSADSHRKAIDKYQEALQLLRAANDRMGEATALTLMSMAYSSIGENQKAVDNSALALPIFRAVGDRAGEADALNIIGAVYNLLGEKQKSIHYLELALPLYRLVGDRLGEAAALNNLGSVYNSIGERQKALDNYALALPLIRALGNRFGEASMLNNIGFVYDSIGEKQKALDNYTLALSLLRAVGDRNRVGVSLNNIGLVYDSLGEKQKALDNYAAALPLLRAVGDRVNEATTLNNVGLVYSSLGEKQKALDNYALALPLTRAVGDRGGEARTLNNIGIVYESLGEKQKALDNYELALPILRAVGNRSGEARTLSNIAFVYESLGASQKAFDYHKQALTLGRATGDRLSEVNTLAGLATVERDRSNLSEARARIEEALTIVESLRTKIVSRELRSSYFSTVQKYYDFYIDLLMRLHAQQSDAGNDAAALQASERGRARSLLETLAEANADIRQGVDPTLVARERSLQQQLNTKAQAQMRLLGSKHTDAQAEAMAKEIEALTTDYQQVEAQIRQTSPSYAALTQPQTLTLAEIQQKVLDKDTVLLEYSLGDEHSYLWAVTPTSISSYELPKREEIESLSRLVYAYLTDVKRWKSRNTAGARPLAAQEKGTALGSRADAERLSRILLGPVARRLGNKRLLIVADGALQYIPFAALPSPGVNQGRRRARKFHPLVMDREIVSLPSASTLAVLRQQVMGRKPAGKTVSVLADPVFELSDERVSQAVRTATIAGSGNQPATQPANPPTNVPIGLARSAEESGLREGGLRIPRLPGTRREATQILALVPHGQSRGSFDFDARRETAMSDELSQYRYVHFATHGFLNSLHPELSGLVFSMVDEKGRPMDGFLRANEIFNMKLTADLVVLSACQTGLGKEIRGEGLVSLTRGFMYAGAPRVVVSLWSVSDAATAELMTRFYRGMLKEGLRPAAALRAAQVSLMKEKKWESPYYWAAFSLQGEWR